MRVLKYILHILAFMAIYIAAMFVAPNLTSSRVGVCVILGVVTALEMVYVWFKGKYFAVPISLLAIMFLGMFYFNHPANHDMRLGMWVLAKFLVLPYAAGSLVAAIVMKTIVAIRAKKEQN